MGKKVTIYGLKGPVHASEIANAIATNVPEVLVKIEDTTPEEDAEHLRKVMLMGPDEMFGRTT